VFLGIILFIRLIPIFLGMYNNILGKTLYKTTTFWICGFLNNEDYILLSFVLVISFKNITWQFFTS
jgi:hypothetical protein